MNGLEFMATCAVIACLVVYVFLRGQDALDETLARWEWDRLVRESVRREEAKRAALQAPRSVPGGRR